MRKGRTTKITMMINSISSTTTITSTADTSVGATMTIVTTADMVATPAGRSGVKRLLAPHP